MIIHTIDCHPDDLETGEKHKSQMKWMRDHDGIDFLDFVKTVLTFSGLQNGVKYTEGFRLCKCWPRIITKRL